MISDYTTKRAKSEKAYSDAKKLLETDVTFIDLEKRFELIKTDIDVNSKRYLLTYGVHPEDVHKTNFNSQENGSYLDSVWRGNPIPGEAHVSYRELDVPTPDKPIQYLTESPYHGSFGLFQRFAFMKCLWCHQRDVALPMGFLCTQCFESQKEENGCFKHDSMSVQWISTRVLEQVKDSVDDIDRYNKSLYKFDNVIEVRCLRFPNAYEFVDDYITIRLILLSRELYVDED